MLRKHSRFYHIFAFLLCFAVPAGAVNEHVWLRVEGKYIRTSPYAANPNALFVPVAPVYDRGSTTASTNDTNVATWMKNKGANAVRITYYPYNKGVMGNVSAYINSNVLPAVNAMKARSMYSYIDCHEYFHQGPWYNNWMPTGPIWTQAIINDWINHWVAVATIFKDEPWMLGYELVNEPYGMTGAQMRGWEMQAIQAIRQVDPRHIIIAGTNAYKHARGMLETWEPVRFKADEPYNNVVFGFHEYTNDDNPAVVAPILDYVRNTYGVPLQNTEFGAFTITDVTAMTNFERDFLAMVGPRKIGWAMWAAQTSGTSFTVKYTNSGWEAALLAQTTPVPTQGSSSAQVKTQVLCGIREDRVYSGGVSAFTVARITDAYGMIIPDATDTVTFSISGSGSWSDGSVSNKTVQASGGVASIALKSTNAGTCTVRAAVNGLTSGSDTLQVFAAPVRLALTAQNATLPADSKSTTLLTASVRDANNNIVEIAEGTVNFSASGPGTIWLSDTLQGSSRDIIDLGKTYVLLRAGATPGTVNITASMAGLQSASVSVGTGMVAEPTAAPETKITVYPNPGIASNLSSSNKMRFTGFLPGSSVRLFTISGRQVASLEDRDTGETQWDGCNMGGASVNPGIYVYVVISPDGTRHSGKIIIQ